MLESRTVTTERPVEAGVWGALLVDVLLVIAGGAGAREI